MMIGVSVVVLLAASALSVWLYWTPTASAPKHKQSQAKTDQDTAPDTPAEEPRFDKQQYSTSDPASLWVIVNKQHPIDPLSYAPSDLVSVGNNQRMRSEAADALKQLFADAKTAGFNLVADSGYRSYNTQVSTYNGYVKQWGQEYTDTVSARPGFSEHQTGWAVDIGTNGCHVDDCFASTAAGQWTAANAYKYGFIMRYPDGLTDTTGYSHESWHFRYIGTELSTELHDQNIQTLEEFFGINGGTTYKQ